MLRNSIRHGILMAQKSLAIKVMRVTAIIQVQDIAARFVVLVCCLRGLVVSQDGRTALFASSVVGHVEVADCEHEPYAKIVRAVDLFVHHASSATHEKWAC